MKLFIGLGNPEKKYINTRHNAGFVVINKLLENNINNNIAKKSPINMNNSGEFVKKLINYYKISLDNLYIIHDDLDIKLGEYKIQKGKGPKDHNGIISVEEELKSKDFWRIRIGIDNRDVNNFISGEEYTLQKFTEDEYKIINNIAKKIVSEI